MTTSLTEHKSGLAKKIKAIELNNVGKKYFLQKKLTSCFDQEDLWVLKNVSFEVYRGEVLGIIGRNGAGKTTLLNIIAGALSPAGGEVLLQGKVLGLFNLGVGFQEELTGRENVFLNGAILGASRKELDSKIDSIIEFSELGDFINMPLGSYSQGMRLRLAFSIVVNLEFDILVIDEVLAVGDALFQNKCFEKLMDFRREGKTFIITTQSMEMIERLCDKAALLDHGRLLFCGEPPEAINKYRQLLNTEKFFVGPPQQKKPDLIENTKKWADDISGWGSKLGTKEVRIDSVKLINRFGFGCKQIRSGESLKVKVSFTVKNKVCEPHFGVAIFRKDGVYCYGPNTAFDGHKIPELRPGKGYFILDYRKLLLAQEDYKVSIAIWDKNESLAFDHHYGCYELTAVGADHEKGGLLNMPFEIVYSDMGYRFPPFFTNKRDRTGINPDLLPDKFGQILDTDNIKVEYVKFLDHGGNKKDIFMTNERVKFTVGLDFRKPVNKGLYLWFGIYRDDGIYCQGVTLPIRGGKNFSILFPKLSLLPGRYSISIGIWDSIESKFLIYHHGVYPLKMVFDKQDHGTIYLEHKWRWSIPNIRITGQYF